MFSQEDLDAYNRVQNTIGEQSRQRGRLARILAWVFIPLFVIAAIGAGALGYILYQLNQDYVQLQGDLVGAVANYNESVATVRGVNAGLNRANETIQALNTALDTERQERNAAVRSLNEIVASLAAQLEDERSEFYREIDNANREIAAANQTVAAKETEKQDWINYYANANADLENVIASLEESVLEYSTTNASLVKENDSLIQQNYGLESERNRLAANHLKMATLIDPLQGQVRDLEDKLAEARIRQVVVPDCSSNYYVKVATKTLACAPAPGS